MKYTCAQAIGGRTLDSPVLIDPAPRRAAFEWPTWAALAGCYLLWVLALSQYQTLGWWIAPAVAISVGFHSSLQHEILHGHPTRNALVNEALVFLPLGLAIPYRRFRDLHLTHHNNERLTDPFDDPESFYVAADAWGRAAPVLRAALSLNATFAGRMVIGPVLAMIGFWSADVRRIIAGDRAVQGAWARHLIGGVPVILAIDAAGMAVWEYIIMAAWPGMSLIMVRSFIEHRADETAGHRTAIVEPSRFWRLLFLDNNYHSVHHLLPALAWYRIGPVWRANRETVLRYNGGYLVPGYGAVVRRWGLRAREPVVHPFSGQPGGGDTRR